MILLGLRDTSETKACPTLVGGWQDALFKRSHTVSSRDVYRTVARKATSMDSLNLEDSKDICLRSKRKWWCPSINEQCKYLAMNHSLGKPNLMFSCCASPKIWPRRFDQAHFLASWPQILKILRSFYCARPHVPNAWVSLLLQTEPNSARDGTIVNRKKAVNKLESQNEAVG